MVQKNAEQSTADAKLSSMISGAALGEALNRSHVSLFTDKDLQIDTQHHRCIHQRIPHTTGDRRIHGG